MNFSDWPAMSSPSRPAPIDLTEGKVPAAPAKTPNQPGLVSMGHPASAESKLSPSTLTEQSQLVSLKRSREEEEDGAHNNTEDHSSKRSRSALVPTAVETQILAEQTAAQAAHATVESPIAFFEEAHQELLQPMPLAGQTQGDLHYHPHLPGASASTSQTANAPAAPLGDGFADTLDISWFLPWPSD